MALETLKGIESINGYKVCHMDSNWPKFRDQLDRFIRIDHKYTVIAFHIQDGPVKENGVNGCQVDTIIEAAKLIIEGLNKNFPCRENSVAITKLDEALMWLEKRKKDREKRGVEGLNEL
jgi:hypothetical protein